VKNDLAKGLYEKGRKWTGLANGFWEALFGAPVLIQSLKRGSSTTSPSLGVQHEGEMK
jgi:hypothetical protein